MTSRPPANLLMNIKQGTKLELLCLLALAPEDRSPKEGAKRRGGFKGSKFGLFGWPTGEEEELLLPLKARIVSATSPRSTADQWHMSDNPYSRINANARKRG